MIDLKSLRAPARAEGAEWYQIYLAEKLTGDYGGTEELYALLLDVLIKNDRGHLRIELDKTQTGLLEQYPLLVRGDESPFIMLSDRPFIYTRKRKEQEDRFIALLESLLKDRTEPLPALVSSATGGIEDSRFPDQVLSLAKKISSHRFFIITGGPGTGKTTLVANLIRLLRDQETKTGSLPIKISLAAPTGRAAKRVEQSLGLLAAGEPAQTLHKLLGINFKTGEPRYHRKNPLPADLIIIDEASMVDLRMMTLLFDGLSAHNHLLLVGDRDQLPSVEAGALLSDFLFDMENVNHRLHNQVLVLDHVYRSNRTIIDLSKAVIEGREADVFVFLKQDKPEISHESLPARAETFYNKISRLYGTKQPGSAIFDCDIGDWEREKEKIQKWFSFYNEMIVLTPARKGLFGTDRINKEIRTRLNPHTQQGIPVMITKNDYDLDLFNGDRGVIFSFRGEYHAFFPESFRHFPLASLSDWELSWVQTIHKSQGSEYSQVQLILPAGTERLLSREILYTGLTRARDRIFLYSQDETIKACLEKYVMRNSRIREVLLSGPLPV